MPLSAQPWTWPLENSAAARAFGRLLTLLMFGTEIYFLGEDVSWAVLRCYWENIFRHIFQSLEDCLCVWDAACVARYTRRKDKKRSKMSEWDDRISCQVHINARNSDCAHIAKRAVAGTACYWYWLYVYRGASWVIMAGSFRSLLQVTVRSDRQRKLRSVRTSTNSFCRRWNA